MSLWNRLWGTPPKKKEPQKTEVVPQREQVDSLTNPLLMFEAIQENKRLERIKKEKDEEERIIKVKEDAKKEAKSAFIALSSASDTSKKIEWPMIDLLRMWDKDDFKYVIEEIESKSTKDGRYSVTTKNDFKNSRWVIQSYTIHLNKELKDQGGKPLGKAGGPL